MAVSISTKCCFVEEFTVKKASVQQYLIVYRFELWKSSLTSDWIIGCLFTEMPSTGGKLLLLIKSSASYISTAWISPQGLREMYLRFKKVGCLKSFYHVPLVLQYNEHAGFVVGGKKWLELNIYSHASEAGIKVSENILLRDTFSSVRWCRSSCHIYRSLRQVRAALDWAAFKSPACTKWFSIFSADMRKKQAGRCRNKAVICITVKASYGFISGSVRGLKWLLISKATSTAYLSGTLISYDSSIHLIAKILTSAAIHQLIGVPAVFLCVLTAFSIDLLHWETNCVETVGALAV